MIMMVHSNLFTSMNNFNSQNPKKKVNPIGFKINECFIGNYIGYVRVKKKTCKCLWE